MINFLYQGNWFEKKYKAKSDSRYLTFKTALNLFLQRDGKIIVETGTTRMVDDWGAGMSTLLFADFLQTEVKEGYLSTVDISEENIKTCKEITKGYSEIIEYMVQDSLIFLKEFPFDIDLLYLDSLDYPLKPEEGSPEVCRQYQLEEYLVAKNRLSKKAIVLLDDNLVSLHGKILEGKTTFTKKKLLEDGWELLIDGQQSLWQR